MSVFHCHPCDKNIDSDYIECHEWADDLICDDCYQAKFEKQKAHWEPRYKGELLAGLIGPKENTA